MEADSGPRQQVCNTGKKPSKQMDNTPKKQTEVNPEK